MEKALIRTALFTVLLLASIPTMAVSGEQTLISDPNFPLIQLPATFDSHRSTKRVDLAGGQEYELINAEGPGCVRHFWITTTAPDGLELEIACDGVEQNQVKMKMHQFFGVLMGKEPYRIESAPIKLLPRNGYNSYFPIPFQSSCKIVLRNTAQQKAQLWSMVDWQKYESNVTVTPYRLHALFSEEKPAEPLGTTLLGSLGGKGFVAGMFHAIERHDMRDMIWHTGGDTWLIDGETNPHVIRGIGSEDVFGYSFGVYKDLSQWTGGVHAVGENANTSEIVAYRFFGPDSIAFKSSMVLRFGTRANDIESVLYYYQAHDTKCAVSNSESFSLEKLPEQVENGTAGQWDWGHRKLSTIKVESEHTWVDFARWFRRNQVGNTGTQPDKCAAYATTVITSPAERKVKLRLGFDDWMKVWLNGKPLATLHHDDGIKVSEVPALLERGDNRLVVRLSNFDNTEWRCWAFSCVIENAEPPLADGRSEPRR